MPHLKFHFEEPVSIVFDTRFENDGMSRRFSITVVSRMYERERGIERERILCNIINIKYMYASPILRVNLHLLLYQCNNFLPELSNRERRVNWRHLEINLRKD